MTILGEHHVSVSIDRAPDPPIRLEASALTIRMDEEWVPYVQAEVVCPLGDGDVTRIDPQTSDVWVTNTVRRTFGRIDRISDLTRRYRGKTIAALTERFRGQTVEAVTRSLYHDFTSPDAPRRAETRPWRLLLREVSVNRKAGTVAMTLASGEARLGDWTHLSDTPLRVVGQTMVDKLENVLRLAGFTGGIDFTSGPNPTDAEIGEEAMLVPGATALEYVTSLTRHHGLMLWCDELGLWHLAADRSLLNVRKLESFGPARSITEELSTRSRDDGWVTAVMAVYTWENVDHYDIYPPADEPRRPGQTLVLKFARPYPGPGRAESTYRQVVNRGRSLELDAVSVYLINPGQSVEYTSPREVVRGRLAAIRWQFPDDAMSIRLREVGVA